MQISISSSISTQIEDRETNKQSDLSSLQIIILLNLLWFGQAGIYPAAALVWSAQSRDECASALSQCPCVLIPLHESYEFPTSNDITWLWTFLAWKAELSALTFSQSVGGRKEGVFIYLTQTFLLPFWEVGTTFPVVTPGRFSIPAWLTCTSPLSTSKEQLPKGSMRWRVLAFPMLHCLIQTSSHIQEPQDSSSPASQSLLASWSASFGGQWAHDPTREPMWPLHIGGDKENRADDSWQSSQKALLKHTQEVLSFPSCLCKLNLLQVKTSFKICSSALAHSVLTDHGTVWCSATHCSSLKSLGTGAFQGQGWSRESSALAAQLPAETQQPLWDYRPRAATDETGKELSPRCSCHLQPRPTLRE